MTGPNDPSPWSRMFRGSVSKKNIAQRRRFEELTRIADSVEVRYQDLTQPGYRAPGDLVTSGFTLRYDWRWRADELARRLDLAITGDPPPAD